MKVDLWKKHLKMTCNLIVPHGKVRFVFFNEDQKYSSAFINGILN